MRISKNYLTSSELIGSHMEVTNVKTGEIQTFEITEEMVLVDESDNLQGIVNHDSKNFPFLGGICSLSGESIVLPVVDGAGLYFMYSKNGYYVSRLIAETEIIQIDEKFIPDTIARKTDIPTKTSQLTNDSGFLTEHQDLSNYATKSEIPTSLSQLSEDETHRVVTDEEKALWNSANSYTDTKIAGLINGAPTTLDTLKEIADAMSENQDVVSALEMAIGVKADLSDLNTHKNNTEIHVTSNEKSKWNIFGR